jgi:hypothetical protein
MSGGVNGCGGDIHSLEKLVDMAITIILSAEYVENMRQKPALNS